jgi:uncharacterized protein (DUF427 family)
VVDYPTHPVREDHVERVPRRIRAWLAGEVVLDTTRALYVWEHPAYPQYYVPVADVKPGVLTDEDVLEQTTRGTIAVHGVRVRDSDRPGAARVVRDTPIDALRDTVRFSWPALEAWFEEDEQILVHPRNPYVRVDVIRSSRAVRVESHGVVLAESFSPLMLFETGLPTRYYLDPTDVDFSWLVASDTVTSCPYKGTTSGYWSAVVDGRTHPDVAWSYRFPTRDVLPVAGLLAFYNEKVDIVVDGVQLERPRTTLTRSGPPAR